MEKAANLLTSISLQNFKAFQKLRLELHPITVLIGPNGTGKSSIGQALMLLRQSAPQQPGQPPNQSVIFKSGQPYESFIDLIGFEHVVSRGDLSRAISIGFTAETELPPVLFLDPNNVDGRASCAYEVAFTLQQGWPQVVRNLCEIRAKREWKLATNWQSGVIPPEVKDRIGPFSVTINPAGGVGSPFTIGQVERRPLTEGAPGFEENVYRQGEQEIRNLAITFAQIIHSWRFVPPLRGFAQPDYPLASGRTSELRLTEPHDKLSAAIASTLGYTESLEDQVSRWVERITKVPVEHSLNVEQRIGVRAKSAISGRNVSIVLEGFGTNQLVFLMFQLALTPTGGLATVDEPETHLHPLAIAELGNVLAEVATQEKKQLLVTTHSEHLLLSLLNNVAEKRISPEDLAVYYFSVTDRTAAARRLEVTSDGMVKGGLPGFFDAALLAQRRLLTALEAEQ